MIIAYCSYYGSLHADLRINIEYKFFVLQGLKMSQGSKLHLRHFFQLAVRELLSKNAGGQNPFPIWHKGTTLWKQFEV